MFTSLRMAFRTLATVWIININDTVFCWFWFYFSFYYYHYFLFLFVFGHIGGFLGGVVDWWGGGGGFILMPSSLANKTVEVDSNHYG